MKRILLCILLIASSCNVIAENEPVFKATFEEGTPLRLAIEFIVEDEGFTLANSAVYTQEINGTYTGNTVQEIVNAIAISVGKTATISDKTISLQ